MDLKRLARHFSKSQKCESKDFLSFLSEKHADYNYREDPGVSKSQSTVRQVEDDFERIARQFGTDEDEQPSFRSVRDMFKTR